MVACAAPQEEPTRTIAHMNPPDRTTCQILYEGVSNLDIQDGWAEALPSRDRQEDCEGSFKLQREQER